MTAPLPRLLDDATAEHQAMAPEPYTAGHLLDVVCATWGVPGLADAVHRHQPGTGRLLALATAPAGPEDLVPGADAAAVAAVVVVTGALAAAVARDGDDGHRLLLVATGALLAALAAAAGRLGLPSCEVAQVFPQPMRELAAVDGYRSAPLGAVVLGHPAPHVRRSPISTPGRR